MSITGKCPHCGKRLRVWISDAKITQEQSGPPIAPKPEQEGHSADGARAKRRNSGQTGCMIILCLLILIGLWSLGGALGELLARLIGGG